MAPDDEPKKRGRGGPRPNSGGARPGAGRPPAEIKNEGHHVSLPPWAVTLARVLGDGNLSRGLLVALEKIRGK